MGITEGIKFKTKASEKEAKKLAFTQRQATAILEMRLYKLIGLEIEALMKEHQDTLDKIARYEDILNNYDSMAQVIMKDLDGIKKEYGRKRRTVLENAEEIVFEEKKIEGMEIVFLMDRFGYAKTVDVSTYERNREPRFGLFYPCVRITVTVEHDTFMLDDGFFDQFLHGSIFIGCFF